MAEPDFNFLLEPPEKEEPLIPEVVDDKALSKIAKMNPRKAGQIILDAFDRLGGVEWLLGQAIIDPRGFIELLKKVLPKTIQAEGLDGLTVLLRDQYGNTLEVNTLGRASPVPATGGRLDGSGPGQPQIATSGNPTAPVEVQLKETYE